VVTAIAYGDRQSGRIRLVRRCGGVRVDGHDNKHGACRGQERLFTPASLMAFSRWSGGDQQLHECVYVPLGPVIVCAINCAMGSGL
jgi:hypothetical protein